MKGQTPEEGFPEEDFPQLLAELNRLDDFGFHHWVFRPGMMYEARYTWWGEKKERRRPHEGLDVCLYSDRHGRLHRLDANTKVPAAHGGVVVKIIDDFLGKSMILAPLSTDRKTAVFFTIYGHTDPVPGIGTGRVVRKGEVIATIAAASGKTQSVTPHLHLTMGTMPEEISFRELTWEIIGSSRALTLFDPLEAMRWGEYRIED